MPVAVFGMDVEQLKRRITTSQHEPAGQTTRDATAMRATTNTTGDARNTAADLRARFHHDGYVVLPEVLDPTELHQLQAESVRLCRGDLGSIEGATTAVSTETEDEVLRRFLCIHYPHKISDVIRTHMTHPYVVAVLKDVIGPNIKSMQSMLFIKAEGKPGQAWHQDEFFIPTRDRSLTAAWTALDDATVENGCLWVLPGSHRAGVIYPNAEHDDRDYDCSVASYGFPYREEDAVAVEVEAGSTVLFNGYLLHKSLPHRGKGGYRRALVNHYMSAESLLPWFMPGPDVTQMGGHDYRDIVMVAGQDPYAYKGTAQVARARLRPDGAGGCDR
jgi:ectoine hydroxylase-related dioxygenase (phytanoyl-CoA dioxygenase family)